jgi:hypothetical protein
MNMKPTLDQLLQLAGEHAGNVILGLRKDLMPTWILINRQGPMNIIGTPWRNEAEKLFQRVKVKHQMEKAGTVAYSFVTEAWAASQAADSTDTRPPVDRPDRRECVMAVAANGTKIKYAQWEIIRDWNERVIKLKPIDMEGARLESWLAKML